MIIEKCRGKSVIPFGYVAYGYMPNAFSYKMCKWYAYPIFRAIEKFIFYKLKFYCYLNMKGIMNTPEFCEMRLSDLKCWIYIKTRLSKITN